MRASNTRYGRFANLDEVLQFYSTGIQDHPNLTAALRDEQGSVRHFNLNDQQKSDIIAFPHTLTDTEFLTDEKFSDPFIAA